LAQVLTPTCLWRAYSFTLLLSTLTAQSAVADMPRGHGRSKKVGLQEPRTVDTSNPPSPPPVDPNHSTDIFFKTKMCKFHILGVCARGDQCLYAHSKEQLIPMPDLSYTKLCPTLIRSGQCKDSACKFAHDRDELRTSATHRGRKLCKINVREQAPPAPRGKGASRGALDGSTGSGGARHTPLGTWHDAPHHLPHEQAGLRLGNGMPPPQDMTAMATSMQAQMVQMPPRMAPASPEGQGSKYGCQLGLMYAWSPADYAAGVPGLGANNGKFPNMWMVPGWRGEEATWSCAETADTDFRTLEYAVSEDASPESISSEEVLAQQQFESPQQDQSSGSDGPDDDIFSPSIMVTQQTDEELDNFEETDGMFLSQGPFLPQVSRTSLEEAQFGYFDDLEGIKVSVKNTFLQFEDEASNFKGLRKVLSTGGRLDQLAAGS